MVGFISSSPELDIAKNEKTEVPSSSFVARFVLESSTAKNVCIDEITSAM